MKPKHGHELQSRVISAKFFDAIGYSTVWEDERVIEEGLAPKPGERALSITSGGCFSLQFLMYDVAEVISLDFNVHQSDLLCLKLAAACHLSSDELWQFMGLSACQDRHRLYERLRKALAPEVRGRIEHDPRLIQEGITRMGKQDRYLHMVGRLLLGLQGKRRVAGVLSGSNANEQAEFFHKQWNNLRWRVLCGLVFNRWVLHKAFDKEHFTHSQADDPARRLRLECERVLANLPGSDNFYLHYLFHRTYPSKQNCPMWLRESNLDTVRARASRVKVHTGQLEQFLFAQPTDSIDCFNLSNAFDWVSKEVFTSLMREIVRVARDGARLCYWTNVVNTRREIGETGITQLIPDLPLSQRLSLGSRTAGYSGCVIARVSKAAGTR